MPKDTKKEEMKDSKKDSKMEESKDTMKSFEMEFAKKRSGGSGSRYDKNA